MNVKRHTSMYLSRFSPRHAKINPAQRGFGFYKVDGKFDAAILERVIKETLTEQGLPENALLKDMNDHCRW